MTEQQNIELGKRAVSCKGWRWLPGMLGRRDNIGIRYTPGRGFSWRDGMVPDLRDPCTLGGLLHLVREAWGDPRLVTGRAHGFWCVIWGNVLTAEIGALSVNAESEAEALVCALEAAP